MTTAGRRRAIPAAFTPMGTSSSSRSAFFRSVVQFQVGRQPLDEILGPPGRSDDSVGQGFFQFGG